MSDYTTSDAAGGGRTVTAFFDTSEHAATAKTDLIAAGIPESAITMVGSNADHFTAPEEYKGFWESLADFFMPDDDRRAYAEGLRRGGFALSVRTDSALYDKAIDVLDRDGAVDLDERELEWKDDGWSPAAAALGQSPIDAAYLPAQPMTAGFGASHAGEDGIAVTDEATNPDVRERIGAGTASQTAPASTGGPETYAGAATPAGDAAADRAAGRTDPGGMYGQRDLAHGRTRVRSFIVEGDVNR